MKLSREAQTSFKINVRVLNVIQGRKEGWGGDKSNDKINSNMQDVSEGDRWNEMPWGDVGRRQ